MAFAIRHLHISIATQAAIDRTWDNMEEEDWLLIEKEAVANLKANVLEKTNLFNLPILSEALRKYLWFEQTDIDDAVLNAAYYLFGRPAFSGPREILDEPVSRLDVPCEEEMLTEFQPVLRQDQPSRFSCRLRLALAWSGASASEEGFVDARPFENDIVPAATDLDDVPLREVKLMSPRPPSAPFLPARRNMFRSRLAALRSANA